MSSILLGPLAQGNKNNLDSIYNSCANFAQQFDWKEIRRKNSVNAMRAIDHQVSVERPL